LIRLFHIRTINSVFGVNTALIYVSPPLGLYETCRELDVALMAWSPIGQVKNQGLEVLWFMGF
jgi:diketogulonate reductase-like aldo/keto reductase